MAIIYIAIALLMGIYLMRFINAFSHAWSARMLAAHADEQLMVTCKCVGPWGPLRNCDECSGTGVHV